MTRTKGLKRTDISTEERIKEAAHILFYKKGFVATRTRDIAKEAGINLAMLNYYFRSKQKLFEIIMTETLSKFVNNIQVVLDDINTSLEEKISEVTRRYIDLLIEEPEIPTFLLMEIRNNSKALKAKLVIAQKIRGSVFYKQYQDAFTLGKIKESHPLHFILNLFGLIVFPFIVKPLLLEMNRVKTPEFNRVMEQRKILIPFWLKIMEVE